MTVLIGLANHAHANGRAAFPSQERLAHYARKSVRSVQRDLTELVRLGIVRRGDQRHVAFIPVDRRPVVWDLAMERRRTVPGSLDPFAEPQSGRPTEAPEPVDNRGDAHVIPVDRGDVHDRAARRTRPSGVTPASYKPSLNHQEPSYRASAGETSPKINGKKTFTPRALTGAALPIQRDVAQCPTHRGMPAGRCGACRSEALAGGR
ncbi:helix-turn-helix domain-containing protein [Micromonospora chalcea]|uniref:helix-turn-helix domain-containing protein n=1 Tax=Micromonospora rosaria TaxID=47874 RepID=UPI000A97FCD8|nr:helix-turn-helix domain-containing protein [Micromonospora rosaria]